MKIGLRLFLSSASFSIAIAVAYWLSAHEAAGAFLLGFMAFAMCVIAGYMIVAEREADLAGDHAQESPAVSAGEIIGSYSTRSALPLWTGLSLALILTGAVVEPAIAILGFVGLLALGVAFILQS